MNLQIRYVWLILFLISFPIIFVGTDFHLNQLVFSEKLSTDAEVVEYHASSHSAVFYEYEVDGVIYSGVGSAEGYDRGDQVKIYYRVDRNHKSELVENIPTPKEFLVHCFLGSLWMSSAGSLVFLLNRWLDRWFAGAKEELKSRA